MKKIDLETATREFFAFRPDEVYSFEEVCGQFKRWNARAYWYKRGKLPGGVNRCALSRVIGKLRAEGRLDVKGNAFTML